MCNIRDHLTNIAFTSVIYLFVKEKRNKLSHSGTTNCYQILYKNGIALCNLLWFPKQIECRKCYDSVNNVICGIPKLQPFPEINIFKPHW